jgi:hypothetical protein
VIDADALRMVTPEARSKTHFVIVDAAGVFLDYSKNRVTDETIRLLLQLAVESGLRERIAAMRVQIGTPASPLARRRKYVIVSTATGIRYSPSLAWDGTNFFVVWTDNRNTATTNSDIYGASLVAP